jgi:hypothetical protein
MSIYIDVLVLIDVILRKDPGLRIVAKFWLRLFVDNISQCVLFILLNSFVFSLQLINVKSYVNSVKPTHWI